MAQGLGAGPYGLGGIENFCGFASFMYLMNFIRFPILTRFTVSHSNEK